MLIAQKDEIPNKLQEAWNAWVLVLVLSVKLQYSLNNWLDELSLNDAANWNQFNES